MKQVVEQVSALKWAFQSYPLYEFYGGILSLSRGGSQSVVDMNDLGIML